jgi:hypothetical protein
MWEILSRDNALVMVHLFGMGNTNMKESLKMGNLMEKESSNLREKFMLEHGQKAQNSEFPNSKKNSKDDTV